MGCAIRVILLLCIGFSWYTFTHKQYSPMLSEMKLSFKANITHSFSAESNQEWIGHCCQCERSSLKFGQIKLISPRFQNGFRGVGPRPPSCISTPPHWTNLLTQPKQNIHFLKHKQWFSVSLKSKLCIFCASSMFVFVQFWNGSEQRNTVSLWLTK